MWSRLHSCAISRAFPVVLQLATTLMFVSVWGCTSTRLIDEQTRRQPTDEDALAVALLSDPAYRGLRISPNGEQVAAIRPTRRGDSIVVIPIAEGAEERVLVEEPHDAHRTRGTRVLGRLGWPSDDRIVYSLETPYFSEEDAGDRPIGRDETSVDTHRRAAAAIGIRRKSRLYSIDLTGQRRYLAKRWPDAEISVTQDRIVSWLPNDPDHFLVEYLRDALRVDPRDGSFSVVEAYRNGISSWVADVKGEIRSAASYEQGTRKRSLFARSAATDDWLRLVKYDPYVESGFWLAGFSEDPNRIYVYSDLDSDKTALFEFDLVRNMLGREVFRDSEYDLGEGWLDVSPIDGHLRAIHYDRDRPVMRVVDPEWQPVWDGVQRRFPDLDVTIESEDASDRKLLLRVASDRSAPRVYLHDTETGEFRLVADLYPALHDIELASTISRRFRARDGLEIEVYITRPASNAEASRGVILFPHDGPAMRDVLEWNPVVQFLVHRGFTVVQPNYRGSTGYGREHERKGDLEWGHAVENDLADTTSWLMEEGIATPGRIGIFGTGHGGYLALQALVTHPELYRAGASWGSPTDLVVLRADEHDDALVDDSADDILIGSGLTDRARLIEASPARQADRIKAAVLLGHGMEDPNVNPKHLGLMANALDSAGIEFEAFRYEDELDGFIDDRDRIDFYLRLADFFDRHLAGSAAVDRESEDRSRTNGVEPDSVKPGAPDTGA